MAVNGARRAVFLDKDGTLVEDVPYNVDPARIVLTESAAEGVGLVAARGYEVIVISNQPGAAMGLFPERALQDVERSLREVLPRLDAFYYCPHRADAGCECRKPAAGLIERAARDRGIDLGRSWMIGDILDDVEAGRRAGCRTILLDNGNETEWRLTARRFPDHIVEDLSQAAAVIIETQ
jgi:D-glycero-D-manno-heptose 1,7-bisphosphate phosphatase